MFSKSIEALPAGREYLTQRRHHVPKSLHDREQLSDRRFGAHEFCTRVRTVSRIDR